MRKFLATAALFLLPLIALYAFPFAVFILSRELTPLAQVLARQETSAAPVLYMPAFADYNRPYKILGTKTRDPDVLVLGSSPALEFRAGFFSTTTSFYNAGSAVLQLRDLPSFMEALPPSTHPQVLVLVLAQSMTLEHSPSAADTLDQQGTRWSMLRYFFETRWKLAYEFYAEGKFSLRGLFRKWRTSPNIGLAALTDYSLRGGFRKDGSKDYGDIAPLQEALPASIAHYLPYIDPGNEGGLYPGHISQDQLSALAEFLALCRQRNIYVVSYLTPLAPELYSALSQTYAQADSGFHKDPATLASIFSAYGFPFYDLGNPRMLDISDQDMLDAIHLTETGDLKVLRYLSAREPALRALVNPSVLAAQPEQETAVP